MNIQLNKRQLETLKQLPQCQSDEEIKAFVFQAVKEKMMRDAGMDFHVVRPAKDTQLSRKKVAKSDTDE